MDVRPRSDSGGGPASPKNSLNSPNLSRRRALSGHTQQLKAASAVHVKMNVVLGSVCLSLFRL